MCILGLDFNVSVFGRSCDTSSLGHCLNSLLWSDSKTVGLWQTDCTIAIRRRVALRQTWSDVHRQVTLADTLYQYQPKLSADKQNGQPTTYGELVTLAASCGLSHPYNTMSFLCNVYRFFYISRALICLKATTLSSWARFPTTSRTRVLSAFSKKTVVSAKKIHYIGILIYYIFEWVSLLLR